MTTEAVRLIDDAHRADPEGRELGYADAVERWVRRLAPAADAALLLASRCQHLERWTLPRSSYPMDKPGYLRWRTEQYRRQGARARALCLQGGVDAATAERVEALVGKRLAREADGAVLEDAACLVFLEDEIAAFAGKHADYTAEKYVDILRKTWRKMSPGGQSAARGLHLAEPFAGLLATAIAGLPAGGTP